MHVLSHGFNATEHMTTAACRELGIACTSFVLPAVPDLKAGQSTVKAQITNQ